MFTFIKNKDLRLLSFIILNFQIYLYFNNVNKSVHEKKIKIKPLKIN